ncbi:hypothetical protein PT974_09742 [Cladobotryum mycophilum]|uniref:ATP-grasp domain-containing protein n=1 Tax=Cladobotryum mycophilum TaxID=491253 RepID=A0ABR0SI76_9HYPO
MADSTAWHIFKNLALLCLSLIFLPFSTVIILAIFVRNELFPFQRHSEAPAPGAKTILVTGVSMSKGLAIARSLHAQGHRVIGADVSFLSVGRVSRAVDKFYTLPRPHASSSRGPDEEDPYVLRLVDIVLREKVKLWISASDVETEIQDGIAKDIVESQTEARAIQLGEKDVSMLHGKQTFIEYVQSLGLPVPDTRLISNKSDLLGFLSQRGGWSLQPGGTQYLLKPIGVDDLTRFNMPILPLLDGRESMALINSIPFTRKPSFIVQELIPGAEFCTHALVIRGSVRAFVACPSLDLLMHYTALAPESPLSQKMLRFTQEVAAFRGDEWTGHVSFDFRVKMESHGSLSEEDAEIYPIECNPRVHTAIMLFSNTPEIVNEYLLALTPGDLAQQKPLYPRLPDHYYWIGQDFVEYVIYPICKTLLLRKMKMSKLIKSINSFVHRVQYWKDGTFDMRDPWPWWWLYHVYWPWQFVQYLFRGRWHKLNVSTGKAFKAR